MLRRILSALIAVYLLLGIYFAVVWGYVAAMLHAITALDLVGFLLGLLKCLIVIIGWGLFQAHILPLP